MSLDELEQIVVEAGEPAYRARQVTRWLWMHGAESTDVMQQVPARLPAVKEAEWWRQHDENLKLRDFRFT